MKNTIFSIKTVMLVAATVIFGKAFGQQEPRREFRVTNGSNNAQAIALSDDGRWLMMSADKQVDVFYTRTGLAIRKFEGHTATVTSIAANPRKKVAVSGDESGQLYLWNIDDMTVVQKYETQKGAIKALKFSKDGSQFTAIVGAGNRIRVFDLMNEKAVIKVEKALSEVRSMEINEAKNTLYTAHENGSVMAWTITDTIKGLKTMKIHEGKVTGIRLLRNGSVVTVSTDKTLRITDNDGKLKKTYTFDSPAVALDLSVDQKTAVVATESGKTMVVDLATGAIKFVFAQKAGVKDAFFHPTEQVVVSLYTDNVTRSWILR